MPSAYARFSPRSGYPAAVPSALVYRMPLVVAEADIDPLGHASNIVFVRWIQEVALAHSASLGFDLATYRRLGGVFVISRHEVDYLRPALRGDALEARTWLTAFMAAKCLRTTEIVRAADGEVMARARTRWGFVDAREGRPTRVPDSVRDAFAPYVHAEEKSGPEMSSE